MGANKTEAQLRQELADVWALLDAERAGRAAAVAAERERCAQVCEQEICTCCWDADALAAADHLAAEIRKGPNVGAEA